MLKTFSSGGTLCNQSHLETQHLLTWMAENSPCKPLRDATKLDLFRILFAYFSVSVVQSLQATLGVSQSGSASPSAFTASRLIVNWDYLRYYLHYKDSCQGFSVRGLYKPPFLQSMLLDKTGATEATSISRSKFGARKIRSDNVTEQVRTRYDKLRSPDEPVPNAERKITPTSFDT